MGWGYMIDFYMENGTQYWHDLDFARTGHRPLFFRNETEDPPDEWPKDPRCTDCMDCFPRAVVSFENLMNPLTGSDELTKVAHVLRNKTGMTVLPDEAIPCVWGQTWNYNSAPNNDNRETNDDPDRAELGDYGFTMEQMEDIISKIQKYRTKYSTGPQWTNNTIAQDLVSILDMYLEDLEDEMNRLYINPAPSPNNTDPEGSYYQSLVDWYDGVGRGNRYAVDKARAMPGFWESVKHLYGTEYANVSALPAPAPTEQMGAQESEPC